MRKDYKTPDDVFFENREKERSGDDPRAFVHPGNLVDAELSACLAGVKTQRSPTFVYPYREQDFELFFTAYIHMLNSVATMAGKPPLTKEQIEQHRRRERAGRGLK